MTFMISTCSSSSWTGRAGSRDPEGFYLFIQNKSIIGNNPSIITLPSQRAFHGQSTTQIGRVSELNTKNKSTRGPPENTLEKKC